MTPTPPVAASVTCTRAFWSGRHRQYAFVFTLLGTQQRFTVYTADPYRYEIGAAYTITLTATAPPPGPTPSRQAPPDAAPPQPRRTR